MRGGKTTGLEFRKQPDGEWTSINSNSGKKIGIKQEGDKFYVYGGGGCLKQ